MKPKHREYCQDCGRKKILFDTEPKARNFIRFNWRELTTDRKTLRAYYCMSCGGWHITHTELQPDYESKTEKVIKLEKKLSQDIVTPYELKKIQDRQEKEIQRTLSPEGIQANECLREIGVLNKVYIREYCDSHNINQEVRTHIGEVAAKRRNEMKSKAKPTRKKNIKYATYDSEI